MYGLEMRVHEIGMEKSGKKSFFPHAKGRFNSSTAKNVFYLRKNKFSTHAQDTSYSFVSLVSEVHAKYR